MCTPHVLPARPVHTAPHRHGGASRRTGHHGYPIRIPDPGSVHSCDPGTPAGYGILSGTISGTRAAAVQGSSPVTCFLAWQSSVLDCPLGSPSDFVVLIVCHAGRDSQSRHCAFTSRIAQSRASRHQNARGRAAELLARHEGAPLPRSLLGPCAAAVAVPKGIGGSTVG